MKPFSYHNKRGEAFYPHAIRAGDGRRMLVMRKRAGGALESLPPGYEVRENIHGHVSIRRVRPAQIGEQEEALVRSCLRKLKPFAHAVGVTDDSITIYASAQDRKSFAGSLDADFAEGFASALDSALGKRYGPEIVEMFKANRKRGAKNNGRYYPLLRFKLRDRRKRTFTVQRVCFTGDKAWLALEIMSLPAALMKYTPHLGKDTFFDLL